MDIGYLGIVIKGVYLRHYEPIHRSLRGRLDTSANTSIPNIEQDRTEKDYTIIQKGIMDHLLKYRRDLARRQCRRYGLPTNIGDAKKEKIVKKERKVGPEFYIVKKITLSLTPMEPYLSFHPQKFLEMERVAHQQNLHPDGIETEVNLSGFWSRHENTVIALLQ